MSNRITVKNAMPNRITVNNDVSDRITIETESPRIGVTSINGMTGDVLLDATSIGAVPQRLSTFPTITGFRQGSVYVDSNKQGFRMSLQSIKDMNTKILNCDTIDNADFSTLNVGDYIYEKIMER